MELLFAATFLMMNVAAIPRIIQAWERFDSQFWGVWGMIIIIGINLTVFAILLTSHITIQLPA